MEQSFKNQKQLKDNNKSKVVTDGENVEEGTEVKKKGFFKKLMHGDFGLAATFWKYFILVISIKVIIDKISVNIFHTPIILTSLVTEIIFLPYRVIVLIGIWNAAKKYKGKKIWSILAYIIVFLNFIGLILFIFIMITRAIKMMLG